MMVAEQDLADLCEALIVVGAGIVVAVMWWGIASVRSSMRSVESYVWAGVLAALLVGGWLVVVIRPC